MKYRTSVLLGAVALAAFAGLARADNMASIAITPATGVVTLTPRWGIGPNLGGFHHMAQDLGLGGAANNFYSLKGTAIPAGGDILAFNLYSAGSGAATPHADIGSKLTPNSYSALTSADPDVGYGSVNLYTIHHRGTTDYFTAIIPGSGVASAVTDEKPMSGPGGPATVTGVSGYFGLTFAAGNLGYGLNQFYYLRTDPVTSTTKFGTLAPALLGTSADQFDLGMGGHNALAYTGTDVGYGVNKMYYIRLDPITGFSILGMLDPSSAATRHTADIANLGSVYTTLTFVPGDVGFGSSQFYTTGSVNPTWQSVSFAAIADRAISSGSFTVNPTASSALPITLAVVAGSTGSATISGPVGGVFTVTPTSAGVITLQASQAGSVAPAYEFNMLRQSFTATGATLLAITTQPTSQNAITGANVQLVVAANGTPAPTYQWRKAGVNITGNPSANTNTLTLANVQAADAASFDVVVTNASGSLTSNAATVTVTASPLPVITAQPSPQTAVAGSTVNFPVTASSGTALSYQWRKNGVDITGNTSATTSTLRLTNVQAGDGASYYVQVTNAGGSVTSDSASLTISGAVPVITNSPLTAAGTINAPFSFGITASGSPLSYGSGVLPAGLTLNTTTGVISGQPTTAGVSSVTVNAVNAAGTGSATLTITVAAAGSAPSITSATTAPATVGTPFSYNIVATGSPTAYTATGLAPGLSLAPSTGVISGNPNTAGTYTAALTASNSSGTSSASSLTITVAPSASTPIFTSATTAPATVGSFFTYAILATGNPTSYTASGLPAGLTLNTQTGVISGFPSSSGTSIATLTAFNANGAGVPTTLTITTAPAVPVVVIPPPGPGVVNPPIGFAPIITSPTTAPATAGVVFTTYPIAATGSPTSFSASGLPSGLVIDQLTGRVTGIPTTPGTSIVTISASNSAGTGVSTVTIVVAQPASAPIITSSSTAPGAVGTPFVTYMIAATGLPTTYSAVGLPAGLTLNPLTGAIDGTPTAAGTSLVTITATNSAGVDTETLTITIAPAAGAPIITSPTRATATLGTPFPTYTIAATGLPTSYTATGLPPGLTLNPIAGTINGTATVAGTFPVVIRATNSTGTSTITLLIVVEAASSRIVNFSARALSGPDVNTLIMGFVVAGDGKNLLVRGVGPGLAAYGVTNFLADPALTLFGTAGVLSTNDDWQTNLTAGGVANGPLITSTGVRVGAFPLASGSKDAALLQTFNNGAHTTSMLRPNSTTGVALTEIYDTDETSTSRLINVSARMNVTAGEGTLIAGLVIRGTAPKTVLIRGVGPTLTAFGVTGVLADPVITVFSGTTEVARNDNWETGTSSAAQMNAEAGRVGAFALVAGSRDAALLLTLQPGSYTVQVTGVGGTSGVALVEVYDSR